MRRREFLAGGVATAAGTLLPPSLAAAIASEGGAGKGEIAALAGRLAGGIHLPGSESYERLRRIYSPKADARPALFVHAASLDDVRRAVDFARDRVLPLAVRCGGHSYAGHGLCDGGLVIDLSGLRALSIDADAATIEIGGGALVGMIDKATAERGRATVLGQCPSVGIGGFALGGGVGPLMSGHGLGCDNVLSARLVLADGRVATVSAEENPDLYWAIRGGGGNFGVATAFTMRLHPVRDVFAGNLVYRADKAIELLRAYAEAVAEQQDALTLISVLAQGRDGVPVLSVQATWTGDPVDGEAAVAPLRRLPGLVADEVRLRPYLELQSEVPAEIPPTLQENRGGFVPALTDPVIEVIADALAQAPGGYMLGFVHFNGAPVRVPPDATAFPLRRRGIGHGVSVFWRRPEERDAVTRWVHAYAARMAPHEDGGNYVNVMDAEGNDAVRAAYGANYARLAALKAEYDPGNLFRHNQNVKPAALG